MFYRKGIDITNAKSMYNFLHGHPRYYTMGSWNGLMSIAHNVKLYNLGLDGDMWVAKAFLNSDGYGTVNDMIRDFEADHPNYRVGFNGRSGGYLVLYGKGTNCNVLPDHITVYDYDYFKEYVKEYYGSLKNYMRTLVHYTKLVQDFDRLCDDIRDYINELSKMDFKAVKLEEIVELFNIDYGEDLKALKFDPLKVENGRVHIGYIKQLKCLFETFVRYADMFKESGYEAVCSGEYVFLKEI